MHKVKIPPQGNVLPQAGKVIIHAIRGGFRLDAAKPAFQAEKYNRKVDWDDRFVSEIRRGLKACKVMFVTLSACMLLVYSAYAKTRQQGLFCTISSMHESDVEQPSLSSRANAARRYS